MRTFIAIDLPEEIRAALHREQTAFRAVCPDGRWTKPEGIHVTLKFLGEVSADQVRQVTEALQNLGQFEEFSLEAKGFGFFPDARRPRVFWAGIEAPPDLLKLVSRVETTMEKLGFAREERPFSPHLTLARFKIPRPQPALRAAAESKKDQSLGTFRVSEFFLFESRLAPEGADYRRVVRFPS
ncbi:MAG TPA: RNA 2',3'-cyclic phosphodiesterase [Terriglobia bacterium]|jgi:2'-5' RNA ligase|nr:RNA 2',3'-cyclic phosphodiesterase [Terriglobia bacterium]